MVDIVDCASFDVSLFVGVLYPDSKAEGFGTFIHENSLDLAHRQWVRVGAIVARRGGLNGCKFLYVLRDDFGDLW